MKKLSLLITALLLINVLAAQEIYNLPEDITTKWSSPENWKGEKGKGGMRRAGRKGSASFRLKAGAVQVLAEETGNSGIVHRIWMTMLPRSPKVLSGVFSHRYQGCPIADNKGMRYTFYRYHIVDPVYFYKDIRVTIQQVGFTTGKTIMEDIAALGKPLIKASDKEEYIDFTVNNQSIMFERSDDVATCAFFYLSKSSVQ